MFGFLHKRTQKIVSVGKSDVGLKRSHNEDDFMVRPELGLCILADGMGGAAAGELASRIFVEHSVEVFSNTGGQSEKDAADLVLRAFQYANDGILSHVNENPHHKGMGCTAELMAFYNEGFILGHVGDSRTYRLRKGQLKQLTRDHSLVQDQIDKGLITLEEAKNHSLRNIILRAVGIEENISVDFVQGKTLLHDIFLLCSDGLTDMVDDMVIQDALSSDTTLSHKAENLIELAKSAGGYDNITVILSEVT
ncbi:MAG: Stp1/IreP family PP2C-type Ser/Thr phosphatase [Thermodesulfobacteriota bacterium]|nr:Stp1/IreP family PP2C-type Ser/Thr phosphatase [Thermodesulfobacteriota bacterium]